MTTKRTPTPWAVGTLTQQADGTPDGLAILRAPIQPGRNTYAICLVSPLASMNDIDDANADFIVQACNVHDELVATLQQIADEDPGGTFGTLAERALAKVEQPPRTFESEADREDFEARR